MPRPRFYRGLPDDPRNYGGDDTCGIDPLVFSLFLPPEVLGLQGDFLIKDWLVQPQTNTVEKGSRRWHLEHKVMQVLVQLAMHSDQVLAKERLIETVWRGNLRRRRCSDPLYLGDTLCLW